MSYKINCGPDWDTRVIHITPKDKIGILMSGGIDSLVLYNLLKLANFDSSNILIFLIKAGGEGGEGYDTSERISLLTGRDDIIEIDKFIKHTENDSPNFIPWGEIIEMSMIYILEKYDIDELYNGSNMNPPIEYFPEFNSNGKPSRPWIIPNLWSSKIKCPFLHLYKYHIIDLANKNNINLLNTHSCINNPNGHCGECWFCLEKEWGYEQLKI